MTTPHQPQHHTDGWQPIATAPKDGSMIDLFFQERGRVTDAYFRNIGVIGWAKDDGYPMTTKVYLGEQPSHWRSIPKPPSTTQSQTGRQSDV